jgi:hypothetical protein
VNKFNETPRSDLWENNAVQFARLLAELRAIGLTEAQYTQLASEMDLEPSEIDELLERAETQWQADKERNLSPQAEPTELPTSELLRVARFNDPNCEADSAWDRTELVALLEVMELPEGSAGFFEVYRRANDLRAMATLEVLANTLGGTVDAKVDAVDPRGDSYGGGVLIVSRPGNPAIYGQLTVCVLDDPFRWVVSVWNTTEDQLPERTLEDPSDKNLLRETLNELVAVVTA